MTICAPEIWCRGGLGAGNGVRFRPPSRLAARRGRDGTATGLTRAADVVGRWEKGQGGSETESSTARPSAASDAQPPAILAMARTRANRALSRRFATSTRSSSMVSSSRTTQMDGSGGDGGRAANRSSLRTPTPASLGSQRSAGDPRASPVAPDDATLIQWHSKASHLTSCSGFGLCRGGSCAGAGFTFDRTR